MLNKVILIGRLTRDPELKYLPSGVSVTTFTLAVDRSYTNQQGEREADFIPIVTWRALAETCGKYLTKGRLVAVTGRIQTRNYETQDGQKRYVTEISGEEVQFLERSSNSPDKDNNYPKSPDKGSSNASKDFTPIDDEDDELPF